MRIYYTYTSVAQSLCKHDCNNINVTRVYTKPINPENIFAWFIVSSYAHAKITYIYILGSRPLYTGWTIPRFPVFPSLSNGGGRGKVRRSTPYCIIIRRNIMLAVDVNHHFSNYPVQHCNRSYFSIIIISISYHCVTPSV
jgi:hypothetical protein